MKSILEKYASYTDCYLDYWNNYISVSYFCENNGIDRAVFEKLCEIKKSMQVDLNLANLDFYVNRYLHQNNIKID